MKNLFISILVLIGFTFSDAILTSSDAGKSTNVKVISYHNNNMWESINLKINNTVDSTIMENSGLICEDPEICSCIAAGGCSYDPGSSCRIEFCSGTVDEDPTHSTPKNVEIVYQPCEETG